MSDEPASNTPARELVEEKLKPLRDWSVFFRQRRAIVDQPAVVLSAQTFVGWLPPVRYFLHGLAIMTVASSLLMFGVDRWISNLYDAKIDKIYEAAEQEQKKLDSTEGADREAIYKERDNTERSH